MIISERISEETYERIALGDPDRAWELHEGRLREKPAMSWEHNEIVTELLYAFRDQLDREHYRVRANSARVRRSAERYYVPAVVVIPASLAASQRGQRGTIETDDAPLPLVVEIWSPSTGDYDVNEKLREYQQRGDLEIWRLHPYERTLTIWRRQADGSYVETIHRDEIVHPASLPAVTIDLMSLFDT